MKLIIMTRPTFFVEEDKILTTLFDEGMECLHLNKPEASPIYSERLLSLLPDTSYNKITVHDHYYLKNEYRLAGIHIDDPETEIPRDYKGKFSRTCKCIEDLNVMKKKTEYVFLDNVFKSTDLGERPSYVYEELKAASKKGLIDKHVYACGDITLDNIGVARELGFGGVVVCEDLWSMFDIHNGMDFKELISHFEKLRKAVS